MAEIRSRSKAAFSKCSSSASASISAVMVADPAYPANTANQSTVIRGATYGQMLRNGRVHDTNGILTDGENAVTPGTTVY